MHKKDLIPVNNTGNRPVVRQTVQIWTLWVWVLMHSAVPVLTLGLKTGAQQRLRKWKLTRLRRTFWCCWVGPGFFCVWTRSGSFSGGVHTACPSSPPHSEYKHIYIFIHTVRGHTYRRWLDFALGTMAKMISAGCSIIAWDTIFPVCFSPCAKSNSTTFIQKGQIWSQEYQWCIFPWLVLCKCLLQMMTMFFFLYSISSLWPGVYMAEQQRNLPVSFLLLVELQIKSWHRSKMEACTHEHMNIQYAGTRQRAVLFKQCIIIYVKSCFNISSRCGTLLVHTWTAALPCKEEGGELWTQTSLKLACTCSLLKRKNVLWTKEQSW